MILAAKWPHDGPSCGSLITICAFIVVKHLCNLLSWSILYNSPLFNVKGFSLLINIYFCYTYDVLSICHVLKYQAVLNVPPSHRFQPHNCGTCGNKHPLRKCWIENQVVCSNHGGCHPMDWCKKLDKVIPLNPPHGDYQKQAKDNMRWRAPKSRGETHLRFSQSQVAENWDLEARSRLPTLERGRGSSWEPRD
jgi:hypothetical protein